MKIHATRTIAAVLAVAAFVGAIQAMTAVAALVPTLSVGTVNNGSQVSVTVFGADPNSGIQLMYPTSSSMGSSMIGTTNSSGYFTENVSPTMYGIAAGAPVYVIVDGSQSQTQIWPNASAVQASSGSLNLSQSNISMSLGQTTAVIASNTSNNIGSLSIQSNTNPTAVSAAVSGSQVTVAANATGVSTLNICSSVSGCATLNVSVAAQQSSTQTSGSTAQGTISFSTPTAITGVGQSAIVTIYGMGSYYVSNNSNTAVAATSISGSTLTVTGSNAGSSILSVCGSANGSTSCGIVNVTVTGTASNQTTDQSASSTVIASPSNVDLSIGQTAQVSLTATRIFTNVYYVSSNSNPTAVTANMNGTSQLSLTGAAYGGANITVCQQGGSQCANVYAYVAPTQGGGTVAPPVVSNVPPALTSLAISSNTVGNAFLGSGSTISITWSVNQQVTGSMATIGGSSVPVYGSGSGPYRAIYTMNGGGAADVSISVTNAAGQTGGAHFSLNDPAVAALQPGTPSQGQSASGATFTTYLTPGSTGSQVTALQSLLRRIGVYSGPVTGTFGPLTEAGVKRYQSDHGLTPLGVVGPATRRLLNSEE